MIFMDDYGQGPRVDIGLQVADVVAWHYRDMLKRMRIEDLRKHVLGEGNSYIHYRAKDMRHLKNFLHEYARRAGLGLNHLHRTPFHWERDRRH